ncbi:hypothetical protein OOT00_08770, partial [Desulfobotulus sp. H1]|nr:hypothetical protein [Desulfobotulus pelophilus]
MNLNLSLKGIDQALDNLPYRNPNTPKYRLIMTIRKHFTSDADLALIPDLAMETLIPDIWETGNDQQHIRSRRKNFASLRTAINADLKKMMEEGRNPEGVIIGKNNTFEMADTMREKILQTVSGMVAGGGSQISISHLYELLGLVKDFLNRREKGIDDPEGKELQELKKLLESIDNADKPSTEEIPEDHSGTETKDQEEVIPDSTENMEETQSIELADDEELVDQEDMEETQSIELADDEELVDQEDMEETQSIELADDEELV